MLLVKTYNDRNGRSDPKHTLKVIVNSNIVREYKQVNCDVLSLLLSEFSRHSHVEYVNVATVSELRV